MFVAPSVITQYVCVSVSVCEHTLHIHVTVIDTQPSVLWQLDRVQPSRDTRMSQGDQLSSAALAELS